MHEKVLESNGHDCFSSRYIQCLKWLIKLKIHPVNMVYYRAQNISIFVGQVAHKKAIKNLFT